MSEESVLEQAHPNAIWLAATNHTVNNINDLCFSNLQKTSPHYRCVCHHETAVEQPVLPQNENSTITNESLFKYPSDKLPPPYVDLAIGTRVRLTQNIATQIGLYNGSIGTVYGFAFQSDSPPDSFPANMVNASMLKRELSIVFVQFDQDLHFSISSKVPNLVPIAAKVFNQCKLYRSFYRVQLPLLPSHASTVHRAQGIAAK